MTQAYNTETDKLEAIREAVTPLWGLGFEFIAYITIGTAREDKPDLPAMRALVARVTKCIEALCLDVSDTSASARTGLQDCAAAQSDALRVCERFKAQCESMIARIARGDTPSAEEITAFAHFVATELRPVTTVFVEALAHMTGNISRARIEHQRTSALTMINQINKLGAQINLIAINATIEAARAGDAGRGFSVIASEIQELSRKSKVAVDTLEGQL
jgi:methyl-accepting chemotaxis protein